MKKVIALVICMAMLMGLTGCGGGTDSEHPVTLTMWHNYGGDMQAAMDALIDQFNGTVGKEKGIVINVTAISSSSELNKSLDMIVNNDPGAPDLPDIFTGYPKTAIQFQEKDMIADFAEYFTEEELDLYVDAFVEEGRLNNGGLYVFPIAKSTEVLYLNQTLFDQFAAETGASAEKLATFEGLAELAQLYYQWSGGKQFYAADSWFNFAEVGMAQLGGSIFNGEALELSGATFRHIFETVYEPAVKGGFAIYDGYSSDLSKTGDLICSTGSSAGILFYGDTITYPDGIVEEVEYSILPYPVFEEGQKMALQRGGGLMIAKTDAEKEAAACEFIRWFSAAEQNMKFVEKTGYLPVTVEAFEEKVPEQLDRLDDQRIQKMLTSVLDMYDSYKFFTAPTYNSFDADSDRFEEEFKSVLVSEQVKYQNGEEISQEEALKLLR